MQLVVLGSTGGTGKQVVRQALDGGHRVVALARRPEALGISHPRLEVRSANVRDAASLREALRPTPDGPIDAVVSALGVVRMAEMFGQVDLYSEGGRNLIAAMRAAEIRRLLVVTSGGVEPVDPSYAWFYAWVLKPLVLKRAYADMVRLEELVRGSGIDWTLVRPTALTDGPQTGVYRVSPRLSPPGGTKISRADLAHFILGEAEAGTWRGGTPTVAY